MQIFGDPRAGRIPPK